MLVYACDFNQKIKLFGCCSMQVTSSNGTASIGSPTFLSGLWNISCSHAYLYVIQYMGKLQTHLLFDIIAPKKEHRLWHWRFVGRFWSNSVADKSNLRRKPDRQELPDAKLYKDNALLSTLTLHVTLQQSSILLRTSFPLEIECLK